MAGFLARRRRDAHELEVRDAELAKRAASALLAADERIRAAADELGFAEAELGAAATETAEAVLAAVRRHVTDAFRLNRLNHDAMPGTPDEVRARDLLIVRECEWAERVLAEQVAALAERVAQARRAPEASAASVLTEAMLLGIRADDGPYRITRLRPVDATRPAGGGTSSAAQLRRLREARASLGAATAAACDRAPGSLSPVHLQHAIDDADRLLGVAREVVGGHPGCIGDEAQTRLAEAERLRIDLAHGLGHPAVTAPTAVPALRAVPTLTAEAHRRHGDRLLAMARRVGSLAGESAQLARRDLDLVRAQGRADSRSRRMSWA